MCFYRLIPPGFFQAGEWQSMVQKGGRLMPARPTADKKYVFDATVIKKIDEQRPPLGPYPLVINVNGHLGDIHNQMMLRSDHAILNKIADLPDIYMGLKAAENLTENPYIGLYPIHDLIEKLTDKVASIGLAGIGELIDPPKGGFMQSLHDSKEYFDTVTDEKFTNTIKYTLNLIKTGREPALINADSGVWVILHYLTPRGYDNVIKLDTDPTTYTSSKWGGAKVDAVNLSVLKLIPKVISLVASCTTDLPSWEEWKQMSSAGIASIRSQSRIVQVDHAYLQYLTSIKYRSVDKRQSALKYLKNMATLYASVKKQERDYQNSRLKACERLLNIIGLEEIRLTHI